MIRVGYQCLLPKPVNWLPRILFQSTTFHSWYLVQTELLKLQIQSCPCPLIMFLCLPVAFRIKTKSLIWPTRSHLPFQPLLLPRHTHPLLSLCSHSFQAFVLTAWNVFPLALHLKNFSDIISQEKPHFFSKIFPDAPTWFFQFGQAPIADSSHHL